jgi:hypothetical protein
MGLKPCHLHGMDKIMETVLKDIHFFVNWELDNRFSEIQFVFFLE